MEIQENTISLCQYITISLCQYVKLFNYVIMSLCHCVKQCQCVTRLSSYVNNQYVTTYVLNYVTVSSCVIMLNYALYCVI